LLALVLDTPACDKRALLVWFGWFRGIMSV